MSEATDHANELDFRSYHDDNVLDSRVVASDDDVLDSRQETRLEMVRTRSVKRTKEKRIELLLTAPNYTLAIGCVNLRQKNRARLRHLFHKLVSQHNWKEASGVLSALLQATCRERESLYPDRTVRNNRMIYSAAIELFKHLKSDPEAYSKKIEELYGTWFQKSRSRRSWPHKDRYVHLDRILSSLARKKDTITHDALTSLKQDSEIGKDPLSYMFIGLASFEVWYSGLLEEIRQRNLEESCVPTLSETLDNSSSEQFDGMKLEDADSVNETCSVTPYHSEASVVNDNVAHINFDQSSVGKASNVNQNPHRKVPKINVKVKVEPLQQFSENTVETLDEGDDIMENQNHHFFESSAFNIHGLQWLLPFKLPLPEDMTRYSSYKDYYNDAVKYLNLALQGPPPVSEASLLPLVQLLVLGDQVDEALLVLNKFCNESNSVLPFKLRARFQECVEVKDFDKLSSCFEDVLKKDPTCRHSLTKLIDLQRRGEYAPGRLVEMLALHLEATYGNAMIWRELANCLLKILIRDEDSVCMNGEEAETEKKRCTTHFSGVPVMFVEGISGKTWKLRCKWWLHRHFCNHILTSEIEKGEWELMVYKAACASHLYGKDFDYVVQVHAGAKEYDKTFSSLLREHRHNSLGYFPHLVKQKLVEPQKKKRRKQ